MEYQKNVSLLAVVIFVIMDLWEANARIQLGWNKRQPLSLTLRNLMTRPD